MVSSGLTIQMKLSDWTALNLASEVVEEFERMENADPPEDYDEEKTTEEEEEFESRFVQDESEYEVRELWPWYHRSVSNEVFQALKTLKEDCYTSIPGADIVILDLYARNIYEYCFNPRRPEDFFISVANQYRRLIESAPDEIKFKMVNLSWDDFYENSIENETVTFGVVRCLTGTFGELFGHDFQRLDEIYLDLLLERIFPTEE